MKDVPMSMVEISRRGDVAVAAISRPDRRNALGTEVLDVLVAAFAGFEADAEVHAVVLTAVAPGFCAGADLKEFAGADEESVSRLNLRIAAFCRSIALMAKPVVAGVDGFAMGGGLVVAASCDLVISAPDARWRLPEVSLGWLPGFGLQTLANRIGPVAARRLAWGAETLNGVEAQALALVDLLAPSGTPAREAAIEHAQRLAALPPHAVASAKRFFAPLVAAGCEAMDAEANRAYAEDARHPAAQATMRRFQGR